MTYKIVASIVLYKNDIETLERAIKSFLNTELNVKLYLIDNSPTDNLKILKQIDNRIEYIYNNENVGFGAGHNIAIKRVIDETKYYLVLNPDIYFNKGVLEQIVIFMDDSPKVGHLMPKVLYPDGSIQYLCKTNPTIFDLFARRFLPKYIQKIFQKRMDKYDYKDKNLEESIYDIPYLSGCFMFFRSSILKDVGLFDERIFMYIEDADITRRFLNISHTIYYPYAKVFHIFEKGSHKSWRLTWYSIHGAFVYFKKWGWKWY